MQEVVFETAGSTELRAILLGKSSRLANTEFVSAIDKYQVEYAVGIERTGIVGDEQSDLRFHGGLDKAVHHYAWDHYEYWKAELPIGSHGILQRAGAFGENFSTIGLTEACVCIGDTWRIGEILLQVTQGRQPCFKLNHRFGVIDMAQRVQQSRRTGWYYRVLRTGTIASGAIMSLEERLLPCWPISRVLNYLYVDTLNLEALQTIAALEPLAPSWRQLAVRRIASRAVEDWNERTGIT